MNDAPEDIDPYDENDPESFYRLTPNTIFSAIEELGYVPTGEYSQLNSYENRVYDIYLEVNSAPQELQDRLIVKFYRPGRWSEGALHSEHLFLEELEQAGVPVLQPLLMTENSYLGRYDSMFFSVYQKIWGRLPQELDEGELYTIGRNLARIHNVGQAQEAPLRPVLHPENFGWPSIDLLADWVAPEVWPRYEKSAVSICEFLEERLNPADYLRIHGDCHKGNLIRIDRPDEPKYFMFLDFDDYCNGPAAQDFWMLFSGDETENQREQEAILSGYEELRRLDRSELALMPALRGLRIIHYAAWIARRWPDPTFPKYFPCFRDYTYWAQETEALEKIAWSL